MNLAYATLSRKYAYAFLEVAGDSFDDHDFHGTHELRQFLQQNRQILFFMNLPLMDKNATTRAIDMMFKQFKTAALYKKLVHLVVKQRRALLLIDILHHIAQLYAKKTNMMWFAITTSHTIDQSMLDHVKQFIADATQKRIVYSCHVDEHLIAGVRAQSDTLSWEYSIRNYLNTVQQSLAE